MPELSKLQLEDLCKLGYPNPISCMSSGSKPESEGCGGGSHADVWKVGSANGAVAVAKFWSTPFLSEKLPQERSLRRAAAKLVSCMPRLIGSTRRCTLMSLCDGVTVEHFANQVASDPAWYTVDGIERILVGFVEAVSEITLAGIYNDDMHNHNVLIDYPRRVVWVIDPYMSGRERVDSGAPIVKIISRCITIVAANAREPRLGGLAAALKAPHEYVSWDSVTLSR